jgi:hypothetical protein
MKPVSEAHLCVSKQQAVEDESILAFRWAGIRQYRYTTGSWQSGQYVCGGISESSADWPSGQTLPVAAKWVPASSREVAIPEAEHMLEARLAYGVALTRFATVLLYAGRCCACPCVR